MAVDYTAYAGDDLQIEVTVTTADDEPAYLVGSTATYVIARNLSAKVTKTLTAGDIAISGEYSNIFLIDIDADDTVELSGTYQHELKFVDFSGNTYTAIYGDVEFRATAIRP